MLRKWALLALLLAPLVYGGVLPQSRETSFTVNPEGGVFRSTDGGSTWLESGTGLPRIEGSRTAMPVLSLARQDETHIYALTETAGVFRWNDAASAWTSASHGLPVPLLHITENSLLAVDPANGNR